jgi:hypothetical protein
MYSKHVGGDTRNFHPHKEKNEDGRVYTHPGYQTGLCSICTHVWVVGKPSYTGPNTYSCGRETCEKEFNKRKKECDFE